MVVRRKVVADVMQERGHDPVGVGTVAPSARRRLQGMLQAAHLISGKDSVEAAQLVENPVGGSRHESGLVAREQIVVLARTVHHPAKAYGIPGHPTPFIRHFPYAGS